jgi:antitoxin component of MazEF toxin-antitoxin module
MVALPPEILEGLNWKLGDEVTISVTQEKAILIQKKG